MHELRLVTVTPDGTHLVLEGDGEEQYHMRIDERLTAAVRRDRARSGQLEIALESQLTPRDIQARIRAGESPEDLVLASGMPLERVARYAGPVLAEREHVAGQARSAPSRRQSGGTAPSLGELVEARLEAQRVASDSVRWDAWRVDETRWTVQLSYLAGARERTAEWSFDPRGRVLAPADDEARWLVDGTSPERDEETGGATVRRLASVPTVDPSDQVYDREAVEAAQADVDEPPAAKQEAARAGRRPAVPSWDDIVFGARKRD
jgi:DUF3071 family protein